MEPGYGRSGAKDSSGFQSLCHLQHNRILLSWAPDATRMPTGPHAQIDGNLLLLQRQAGRRDLGRTYDTLSIPPRPGGRKAAHVNEGYGESDYAAHPGQRLEESPEIMVGLRDPALVCEQESRRQVDERTDCLLPAVFHALCRKLCHLAHRPGESRLQD